jgi:MFS family permease
VIVSYRRTWVILLGLALGVAISNGFARFAYGLILPAMREDLGWTYAQAGWINTANALGYVVGAFLTFLLIARTGPARLFGSGIIATSLFLFLSGLTQDFWWLTLWRILTGVFGAPVFIAGGAMAATLFKDDPKRNALAIALYFGGGGMGMILSGATLPALFDLHGAGTWPVAWLSLGIASIICCPLCLWAVRQIDAAGPNVLQRVSLPIGAMRYQMIGYGLFATGYIVYLTFLGAWMRDLSATPALVSSVWITVGISIVVSPFVWKSVLAKSSSGMPLASATGVVASGTLLPIIMPTPAGLFLSACLFGIAVFVGPGAVTSFSRKNLPRENWGRAVGLFTGIFAIGQTIGPVASGFIADAFGGIQFGFAAAGIVLILGAAISLMQKPLITDV